MKLVQVCFGHPVMLPNGVFGNSLSLGMYPDIEMRREGDTLMVRAYVPANENRGFKSNVLAEYNWNNVVSWQRAEEPPAPAKK